MPKTKTKSIAEIKVYSVLLKNEDNEWEVMKLFYRTDKDLTTCQAAREYANELKVLYPRKVKTKSSVLTV